MIHWCIYASPSLHVLTHWGRVTHICVSKLNMIGSDNGLSPGRRQAIIWTNTGILLIWPSGANFSEMLIEIHTFSFKKMHVKMLSAKKAAILSRPQCVKGCVSLDPSKNSKSGWWGLQLDIWQLCNSLWYGLINSKLHINKKIFFLYHTTSDGVTRPMF